MKKFIRLGMSATIIVVALFSINGGAQAQTVSATLVCPAGYTCTLVQPVECPTGYTCIAAQTDPNCPPGYTCQVTNPSVPVLTTLTTDATVTVQGTPTLALTYDANRKESALTATFNISVNGRKSGINLGYGSAITFANSIDTARSTYAGGTMTPTSPVTTIQDNNGQTLYVVPPYLTRTFRIVAEVKPSQMFAGSYYATLNAIYGVVGTSNLNNTNSVKLTPNANRSLSKTIIGETSPYISSISPTTISVGQKMTMMGQRIGGTTLIIDGVPTVTTLTPLNTTAGSGTGLSFVMPTLTSGYHNLQLSSRTTGLSNLVGFSVQGTSTGFVVASLDPSSPQSSTVLISPTSQTPNVVLAVFDVKSQGRPATLQSLQIAVNVTLPYPVLVNTSIIGQLITGIFIRVNGQMYAGTFGPIGKDGIAKFSNFNVPLSADVNVPITVYATIAPSTNNSLDRSTASASLLFNGISAIDGNYNTVPVYPNQGFINSNTITFSSGGAQLSQTNTSISTQSCNSSGYCFQPVTFGFTLTAGNDPVYLSTSVTDTGTLAPNSSIVFGAKGFIVPSKGSLLAKGSAAGDSPTYYLIAPGSSRSFGFAGTLDNSYCPAGYGCFNMVSQIAAINYGTSASNLSTYSISTGLENLRVTVSFPGGITTPPTCNGYAFTTNLQLGSTGVDVIALQTFLISTGYSIPNIMNGSTAKGNFDSQTAAAVSAFQAANGIPETGFVGPLTRAKLNACPVIPTCPAGYVCTPGTPTTPQVVGCPTNYICTLATTQPSITVVSPNGGTFDPGGQLNLQWTSYAGDFDYYQLMLGNTVANSEVEIDDGYHILKTQNSYNTFALWTFVNQIVTNSGMSADTIKSAYYVKVNAVKADRVGGGIVYTGKSSIFTISSGGQPSTDKRASIRQLFLKLQCREPDAQGWDYWTNYSADLSSIQQQMMYSIEYRTKQQIIQIFQQVLGRAPDCSVPTNGDSELNHWFGRAYNNGVVNLDVVRQGLGVITAPCPVGYICTPPGGTTMCPAGYVCTNVTANCPSGYTCYSATPAVSTPTITSFTITPSPTVLGQSATLSWTTTGLTSCNIDSAGNTFLQKIFGPLLGVVKGANDSFTVTIPSTLGILGDRTGTTGTIELGCYTSQLPNITGTYVAKTVTIVIPPKTVSVGSMTTTNITAAIWDAIREYFAAGGR